MKKEAGYVRMQFFAFAQIPVLILGGNIKNPRRIQPATISSTIYIRALTHSEEDTFWLRLDVLSQFNRIYCHFSPRFCCIAPCILAAIITEEKRKKRSRCASSELASMTAPHDHGQRMRGWVKVYLHTGEGKWPHG